MATDTQAVVGLLGAILGAGVTGVRTAAKRWNWEFPAWLDSALGIASVILIVVAVLLLWRIVLVWLGFSIPTDSVWPATILYTAISAALIFAAGYLPAQVSGAQRENQPATWRTPTADGLLTIIDELRDEKRFPHVAKLKVMATEQGKAVADFVVKLLRSSNWELEINHNDGTYIFPSPLMFRGTVIRCRESFEKTSNASGVIYNMLTVLLSVPDTRYFPEDDNYNFIQIEIGDIPEFYR